jgi:hypothetical protein
VEIVLRSTGKPHHDSRMAFPEKICFHATLCALTCVFLIGQAGAQNVICDLWGCYPQPGPSPNPIVQDVSFPLNTRLPYLRPFQNHSLVKTSLTTSKAQRHSGRYPPNRFRNRVSQTFDPNSLSWEPLSVGVSKLHYNQQQLGWPDRPIYRV